MSCRSEGKALFHITVFVHADFAARVINTATHEYLATTSNLDNRASLARYFKKWKENVTSVCACVERFINIEIKGDSHGVAGVNFHLKRKFNNTGRQFGVAGYAVKFNNDYILNREPDLIVGFFCYVTLG